MMFLFTILSIPSYIMFSNGMTPQEGKNAVVEAAIKSNTTGIEPLNNSKIASQNETSTDGSLTTSLSTDVGRTDNSNLSTRRRL